MQLKHVKISEPYRDERNIALFKRAIYVLRARRAIVPKCHNLFNNTEQKQKLYFYVVK